MLATAAKSSCVLRAKLVFSHDPHRVVVKYGVPLRTVGTCCGQIFVLTRDKMPWFSQAYRATEEPARRGVSGFWLTGVSFVCGTAQQQNFAVALALSSGQSFKLLFST